MHAECRDKWFATRNSCPMCRAPVEELAHLSEGSTADAEALLDFSWGEEEETPPPAGPPWWATPPVWTPPPSPPRAPPLASPPPTPPEPITTLPAWLPPPRRRRRRRRRRRQEQRRQLEEAWVWLAVAALFAYWWARYTHRRR